MVWCDRTGFLSRLFCSRVAGYDEICRLQTAKVLSTACAAVDVTVFLSLVFRCLHLVDDGFECDPAVSPHHALVRLHIDCIMRVFP